MTIPEAAEALGLAPSTLRHQIAKKKLRARRMGGRWYVTAAEVARYRAEHKANTQGEGHGTDSE